MGKTARRGAGLPKFVTVRASLADVVGEDYIEAAASARVALVGGGHRRLLENARRKIDLYPAVFQKRMASLLPQVGRCVSPALRRGARGATSASFGAATDPKAAPLSGAGYYRIGQSGRLYLTAKSEHYHAPLGHAFPGYALLDKARALGVPNATHNNTRGHITRLLEERLVRAASGRGVRLDRVLNLETGSLAVEAAVKMMLLRFRPMDALETPPPNAGRTPVFLVVGDDDGGLAANYHGTTIITQLMRGMWPCLREDLESAGIMMVRSVRPNSVEDLEQAFETFHNGRHRIAGFMHELIMMNYGATVLTPEFIKRAYDLCARHDVPTLVDEIQSCLWSPMLFSFREYGIAPDFVALGKGFPGGEYPASRLMFSGRMDGLPLFGALVTNGQEELASLAYLVTMSWAEANAEATRAIGDHYENLLRELAAEFPALIAAVEGARHMTALHFHGLSEAKGFVRRVAGGGLDISVQSYKSSCPPAALTKLPLVADGDAVNFVAGRMRAALRAMSGRGGAR